MMFWSSSALERSGLAVNEGGSLVLLSSTEDDEYPTKQRARTAWEQHASSSGPLRPLVYPSSVYIERYAKQAAAMGY